MQKQLMDAGWNLDNSYAKLPSVFYTKQSAQPVARPKLLVLNDALAASLGLNADLLKQEENVEIFAGNRNPVGSEPLAQAYAGHQFGHFNRLGDGRALLIGEQLTLAGERMDIQLKGSGVTPYSRAGDGRAAIGPMLREYIISEAMQALGVPTTRILAVVSTGETIYRETERPGAVLTRVAASHLRVGTFQYAAALGNVDDLRALADYAIQRHYAELAADDDRYLRLLENVIQRQAALIAKWQQIGFIHGVMNTDNMTISGETIDYGPCAFMDNYNPATVFSSIDTQGRYAYGNQPYIGGWNLARFAESLLPLLHTDEEQAVQMAQDAISSFSELYHHHWLARMRTKLGLFNAEAADEELVKDLLDLMEKHQADYTNTFVALTFGQAVGHGLSDDEEFASWHARWQARLARQEQGPEAVREQMSQTNPAVIPRNHRVEEALERAEQHGDYSAMNKLLAVLKKPYAHTPEQAEYAATPVACDPNYRTFCGT